MVDLLGIRKIVVDVSITRYARSVSVFADIAVKVVLTANRTAAAKNISEDQLEPDTEEFLS